jgi:ABC-type multidrug transport system fused ATPase/permease subunit
MGHFAPGDQKAAWVAIFILFLLWWFAMIPRFFYSFLKKRDDAGGEDTEQAAKVSRAHKAYNRARDGVLLLLVAVTISFAGAANTAATNALAYIEMVVMHGLIVLFRYIFMALWITVVGLSYFFDSKKLFTVLEFLGMALLVALIIMVWGSAAGRYLVR